MRPVAQFLANATEGKYEVVNVGQVLWQFFVPDVLGNRLSIGRWFIRYEFRAGIALDRFICFPALARIVEQIQSCEKPRMSPARAKS